MSECVRAWYNEYKARVCVHYEECVCGCARVCEWAKESVRFQSQVSSHGWLGRFLKSNASHEGDIF